VEPLSDNDCGEGLGFLQPKVDVLQAVDNAIIRAGRRVLGVGTAHGVTTALHDVCHAPKESNICEYPVTVGGTLENAARYVPVHVS
jgi:hypothetical protein